MLRHFDYYVLLGFKIIPLYPKSKVPIGHGWNRDWNEEQARQTLESNRNANIGLLLGDILDVEGDTPEANDFLDNLIGDYPHLCYCGSKSKHHLFLNPDQSLTRVCKNDIEFRAYKHQSVLPPSIHPDGEAYRWLDETIPVQPMPDALFQFYKSLRSSAKPNNRRKLPRGWIRPWCSVCQEKETINSRRYKLEVTAFSQFGRKWECHRCRNLDLRDICRKLKRK